MSFCKANERLLTEVRAKTATTERQRVQNRLQNRVAMHRRPQEFDHVCSFHIVVPLRTGRIAKPPPTATPHVREIQLGSH